MNLLDIRTWADARAFLHVFLPALAAVAALAGYINSDDAGLWLALLFAVVDAGLSAFNSATTFRAFLYPALAAAGALLVRYGVTTDEVWALWGRPRTDRVRWRRRSGERPEQWPARAAGVVPAWTPETWNSFGVVGIVVFVGMLLFVAITREWLVVGRYHRDVVKRLDDRATKDSEAIHILSQAVTAKNATDDATTRILAALREAVAVKGGDS